MIAETPCGVSSHGASCGLMMAGSYLSYVLGGTMATQELNIAPTDNGYMSMAVMMLSAIKDGNTDPVLLDGFVETVTYLKAIERISSVADLG